MNKTSSQNSKWYLITIDDPQFLSGKSIYGILKLLLAKVDFRYVVLNDINGSGKDWLISSMQENEGKILEIDNFFSSLNDVKQFDWGDFFLFKNYPENWKGFQDNIYYPDIIIETDTTVRAIDNQYIYVYTPYSEIVELIKEHYQIEGVTESLLEKLPYPS